MTVERMSRAIWLSIGINMQNDPCNLAPVGTLGVGIQQSQVGHQMFLIVAVSIGADGATSATSGSSGGFCIGILVLGG